MMKLIVIALYLLVLFEMWDRTVDIRKKSWYVFKKLFRPLIIYAGGLNERERIKREVRASQFRNQVNAEKNGRKEKSYRNSEKVERGTERIAKSDNGGRKHLEIIKRTRGER